MDFAQKSTTSNILFSNLVLKLSFFRSLSLRGHLSLPQADLLEIGL